ncbi:MAG: segregation/condensation protein A [Verrucomicrobia bacterium]|nr:segregation/condensation protein A [Verrucomicrobiota bacterium]
MESEYKVRLEVFEGPLDLLLYLIKKEEVDIYDVSIERITRQYLEYVDTFRMLDLEVAGEFVVMAANLIYIKSRSLLPVHQQPAEEDAEEEDPRWDLIRQLIEYKKFKDAAAQLQQRELDQEGLIPRILEKPNPAAPDALLKQEVSIFDLINAFRKVLKRLESKREDLREIFEENFTVSDKIEHIMVITRREQSVAFSDLFAFAASRTEIAVTFLALLELIRLKQLRVVQREPFSEILIARMG